MTLTTGIRTASFKILSSYPNLAPSVPTQMHVFANPSHSPLIAIPSRDGRIFLSCIKHFQPNSPRPFPNWSTEADEQLVEATRNLHLSARSTEERELQHWVVEKASLAARSTVPDEQVVEACLIGEGGGLLIGVGQKKGIWIWRIPKL